MQAMEGDITLDHEGNELHWCKEYSNVAERILPEELCQRVFIGDG